MSTTTPKLPTLPEPGPWSISLRTAAILLAFTVTFTALMAGAYRLTQPAIEATLEAAKLRLINEVLPSDRYDNDLLKDAITLPEVPELGISEATSLYRARRRDEPVALVFEAAAPDGYAGEIRLLLAVEADGKLGAVRVIRHKETPGLGDYIDIKKDRRKDRPWIAQFSGKSLVDPPRSQWRVQKDGGVFEARAGATISARAVTHAVARALSWATAHAEALYRWPAGQRFEKE
ncbi:MAG: electron transport complex subunit RsxG [Rhodocyclaceae bacterium]|nr:electron transport complex subunit RsxG [Rhodocyclaceae bacterium]